MREKIIAWPQIRYVPDKWAKETITHHSSLIVTWLELVSEKTSRKYENCTKYQFINLMLSHLTKPTDKKLIWRLKYHRIEINLNIVIIGIILFIRFSTIQLKLSHNKEVKIIKAVCFSYFGYLLIIVSSLVRVIGNTGNCFAQSVLWNSRDS